MREWKFGSARTARSRPELRRWRGVVQPICLFQFFVQQVLRPFFFRSSSLLGSSTLEVEKGPGHRPSSASGLLSGIFQKVKTHPLSRSPNGGPGNLSSSYHFKSDYNLKRNRKRTTWIFFKKIEEDCFFSNEVLVLWLGFFLRWRENRLALRSTTSLNGIEFLYWCRYLFFLLVSSCFPPLFSSMSKVKRERESAHLQQCQPMDALLLLLCLSRYASRRRYLTVTQKPGHF